MNVAIAAVITGVLGTRFRINDCIDAVNIEMQAQEHLRSTIYSRILLQLYDCPVKVHVKSSHASRMADY